MNATVRDTKLPAVIILLAAALMMLLGGGINKAKAEEIVCSDYELRYNGQIGKVKFPKGIYDVTGLNDEKIVCDYALENLQIFLQNFNNKPTKPWVMSSKVEDEIRTTTFKRGKKSKVGFTVVAGILDADNPPIKETKSCKGSVDVRKAGRIGSLRLSKGSYRVTSLDEKEFNCGKSVKRFRSFLKSRRVTESWKLTKSSATFSSRRDSRTGFYITKNVAASGT